MSTNESFKIRKRWCSELKIIILKKTWTSAGSLAAKYSSLLLTFPSMLTQSNAEIEEKMKEF